MNRRMLGAAGVLAAASTAGAAIALSGSSPASADQLSILAQADAAGVPTLAQQRLALTVGLKPDAVAQVAQSSGAPVVVLRGSSDRGRLVCISRDEQGAVGTSCATEQSVSASGLALYSAPSPGAGGGSSADLPTRGAVNVTVLEPDNVKRVTYGGANGSDKSAPVVNNVATLTLDGAPVTKTVLKSDGTTAQQRLQAASN